MGNTNNSELPEVTVFSTMSVDGRISPARGQSPPVDDWDVMLYFDILRQRFDYDASMIGSTTALRLGVSSERPIELGRKGIFIVPNPEGSMNWTGWQRDPFWKRLVVLCSQMTSPSYIEHLQKEQIPYVVAGEQQYVDLRAALKEIKARYGVEHVVCEGGAALNGALLRAGLVTGVSAVIAPFAVGGIDTPTLFDAPNLASPEEMVSLRLINCEQVKENFVWLRYQVVR